MIIKKWQLPGIRFKYLTCGAFRGLALVVQILAISAACAGVRFRE